MGAEIMAWMAVLLRFTHVIAGIMWIGNSLLFTWMELSLVPPRKKADGAPEDPDLMGTLDMLHGGGVFHLQKRVLHPHAIPNPLHWFMWQSYTTWITGFLLLLTLFHTGSGSFLLDAAKSPIGGPTAIALSLGGIVAGWLVYDGIWRSSLKTAPWIAIPLCLALLIGAAAFYDRFFNNRAIYLQIGAMLGTLMSANVFFHIIANQRKFMAALRAGADHDLALGKAAKQRSLHNHYMTFPVVFLMLGAHFPQLYGADWNIPILAVVIAGLMLVKYFMNARHRTGAWLLGLEFTLLGSAAAIVAMLALPSLHARQAAKPPMFANGPAQAFDAAKARRGRVLFLSNGCAACHIEGSTDLAPALRGLFDRTVALADGSETLANEDYLRESIRAPQAKVVQGYAASMPAFATLDDEKIDALVAYIQSIADR